MFVDFMVLPYPGILNPSKLVSIVMDRLTCALPLSYQQILGYSQTLTPWIKTIPQYLSCLLPLNVKFLSHQYSPGQQQLISLEDAAKAAGKGKWNTAEAAQHVRNVKWTVENPRNFVDSHHNKPIDGKNGVVLHVGNGTSSHVNFMIQQGFLL